MLCGTGRGHGSRDPAAGGAAGAASLLQSLQQSQRMTSQSVTVLLIGLWRALEVGTLHAYHSVRACSSRRAPTVSVTTRVRSESTVGARAARGEHGQSLDPERRRAPRFERPRRHRAAAAARPRSGIRSLVFLVALEMTRLQPHSGVLDCVRSFRSPSYSRGDWRFCTISPHPEVYPSRRLLMLSSRSLNGLRALLVATPVASAVAVAVLLLRARDLTEIRRDPPRLHDMCVS